jgi:hypothetical protein
MRPEPTPDNSGLAQQIGIHDPPMLGPRRFARALDLIRNILKLAADQKLIRRAQVGPQ